MAVGAIVVIIIFGIPMALFLLVFIFFTLGISSALLDAGTEHSSNFTRRGNRHKYYDYYDEPDGFYVTMPDGSVRIDD